MTVKKLIKELQKYPDNLLVLVAIPDFPDKEFVNYDVIKSVVLDSDDDVQTVTINI